MKEKYYYIRDSLKRPVVTVCLLQDNGNIAKGVSICSLMDQPVKKEGRRWARGRALRALGTQSTSGEVARLEAAAAMFDIAEPFFDIMFKSEFNPELSERENRILYPSKK